MKNVPGPAPDLPEPTLDSTVRALLAAIVDALDVPHGDQADDDLAEYALLRRRTDEARIIAASALRGLDPRYIADAAEQLRGWTAEGPVTYRAWQNPATQTATQTADEQPACRRCKKPFDPADTRFDGHAQHKLTPYCRSCVDNCHDGGTEHVCVICDPKRYGGEDL